MARSALGKGLDALIPPKEKTNEKSILELPIQSIQVNPNQPRQTFDPEKINELAQTIQANGILQPILVRKKGDGYEIIAGERRWRAAKQAGLETIPATVSEIQPEKQLEFALIENIQREDLNPIELAQAYQEILEKTEITQQQLSERIGKTRVSIANTLRLLKLPGSIRKDIEQKELSEGHARVLLKITDDPLKEKLTEVIKRERLSVRETEHMVELVIQGNPVPYMKEHHDLQDSPVSGSEESIVDGHLSNEAHKNEAHKNEENKKHAKPLPPDLEELNQELTTVFGTKTSVQHKGTRGRIIIEYYSMDDIDRILALVRSMPS